MTRSGIVQSLQAVPLAPEGGRSRPAADGRTEPPALDLHEGIAITLASGCDRWPASLRLASTGGKLVKGRCRATNLCTYCRTLYTVETVECLTLDAMTGTPPTVWAVVTSREHLTRPEFNKRLYLVRQQMKREGWRVDWFVQVEFQRRGALHANLLVKGVRDDECERWHARFVELWCTFVDALPVGQWCEVVSDALAVSRYVAKMLAHGLKREQAPPLGWKGHRTSHTRGYFGREMSRVRKDARASLTMKREIHKATAEGLEPAEAQFVAEARVLRASQVEWELVALTVDRETGEVTRVRPAAGGGVTRAMRSDAARARRFLDGEHYGATVRAMHEVRVRPSLAACDAEAGRPDAPLSMAQLGLDDVRPVE